MANRNSAALSSGSQLICSAHSDRPAFAAMLIVGALALLGLQDSLIKLTSGEVSLWQFQLLRSLFGLAVIFVVFGIKRDNLSFYPKRLGAVVLRSLLQVTAMVFFLGGMPFLPLSQIAAGLYLFPIYVAVLSALILNEKVGPVRVLAIMAGFFGTMLILKPGTSDFQLYALMPIIAGLCYAATILVTRKMCREEHPVTLTFASTIGYILLGFVGLMVMTFAAPGGLAKSWPYLFTGWHPLEIIVIGVIIACSLLSVAANVGLSRAYQSAESSWLAPFDYSYLVFATFWGIVVWGDIPDLLSFIGMAIIAGSGCYVAWRERREKQLQQVELNRVLR